MKKLLLFLFLMTISLGQSQTLRLGFESGESGNANNPFGDFAIQPVEAGTGSNTSLVLPIIANPGGQIWQGCNFVLTSPVELIASKTMTIDVLSSVPVTFLMKVNGGVSGALEAAAQASHNGDGTWQTISFTFNTALDGKAPEANGVYNNMVLHPFFPFSGSPSAQTFYIDNISGPAVTPPSGNCTNGIQDGTETGIDCGGTCSACPPFTVAAPTPTQAAADVISVFSNTYTDLAGTDFYPNWGQSTQYSQFSPVVGNPTLKYSNLNYQGNQFASPIDASAMQNLHIDIWTPDCTSFQVFLISGVESAVTLTPTLSGWNSYDIPLSSYPTVNKANLIQFKYEGTTGSTVYLDNLYFWKLPAGSSSYYVDADSDGYGAGAATVSSTPIAGSVTNNTDCNDASAAVHPGATEVLNSIDDDCDGLTDEGLLPTTPTTDAPTAPARNAWDVVSLYSSTYTGIGSNFFPNWGQSTTFSNFTPVSDETILYSNLTYQGIELISGNAPVNVSVMTKLHLDVWTPEITSFQISLIAGGENAVTLTPTLSGWNSFDIDLATQYAGRNLTAAIQLKLERVGGGTSSLYLDNIYFYRPATGTPPTLGAFTVPAKVVGDADFSLTAPTSNSAGAFTYTSSNTAVATISGATVTIVGAGSSTITATQAAAGAYDSASVVATLDVSLAAAAPTPTIPGDRVLSVFSGGAGYANVSGTQFYPNWGQATQFTEVNVVGNPTLRYSNLNYQGIQLASVLDVTTYDNLHIDVYGSGTTSVDFRVINQVGGAGSPDLEHVASTILTLAPGVWNSFDIPVSSLTGLELHRVGQLMFVGSGTIYVDNIFFSKAVPTPVAPTVADIAFCKLATSALTATPSGTNTLRWYTSSTSSTILPSAPVPTATKTYYVAQVMSSGIVSPRVAITATVNALPATPGTMTTTDAVLCKHIGTSNTVTYTVPVPLVAPAVAVASYSWTLPPGVTAIGATDANSITVDFLGASSSTVAGGVGTISARAISTVGSCSSAPRSLVLTSKLPTAPTSLTMTSTDSTPHFKGIITPAVIDPPTPAVYGSVGLNSLLKITKVGPYMGTGTVFTLTAPSAATAASYAWTLPSGVTQLSGGTSNVITVDFAGVASGIGTLPIVVKSVGGCGESLARTLTLARALPTAPTALVLTDGATILTRVGSYTGKSTELTLTATPALVQGATATSYAWILPSGVNCITTNTPTVVKQNVNTGTFTPEGAPIFEIQDFAAISTGTASTITIDFAGVASGVTTLPLSVFAVNGAGNSKARTRTVTAAAPLAPSIVGSGGTGTSGQFSSCLTKTYTATSTSTGITSYTWTIPADAQIVGAANGNVIVVDYSATSVAVSASSAVTCYATNGTGNSLTKSLTVKRMPATCRLANASTANDFKVSAYPNPSSSEFTIESSAKGAMSVKVYDMQGRLVEKSNTDRVGSRLAKGVYNVIVNQGANTKSVRVIKN